ncbi:hypothetical protein EV122DRAFT_285261 [Schizophyllum commune]
MTTNRSIWALAASACAVASPGDPPVSSRLASAGVGALQKRDAQLCDVCTQELHSLPIAALVAYPSHPLCERYRPAPPNPFGITNASTASPTPEDRSWPYTYRLRALNDGRAALWRDILSDSRSGRGSTATPLEGSELTELQEVDLAFVEKSTIYPSASIQDYRGRLNEGA